ncbi:MAG: copper amine oxidase N-terminal domain-containing protein [Firmicutes bacterium]|nr:copper amine oxidase N-terminal domain-containing protein [Bacillota bacterium]
MKRNLRIALIVILALAVSTASAFAEVISASFNKINIEVGGSLKAVAGEYFVRTTGDVPYSILYKGTTYLPLAKVCEFVGKDVHWDGNTRTVTISNPEGTVEPAPDSTAEPRGYQDVSIDCVFDSLNIVVNGQTFARPGTQFDRGEGNMVPYSLLYRGTTYLPLAAVCQIVGKDISWNGETYTAIVKDTKDIGVYSGTDVPDFGKLTGLPLSSDSSEDDIMVYNYYDYDMTSRSGKEAEDLQKYVGYLFDAGFTFSLDDSRKLVGNETTTLYVYKNAASGRIVVIGLVQGNELSQAVVSYSK